MNIFNKILIASRRARELKRSYAPLIPTSSGPIKTALEEIEQGKIGEEYLLKELDIDPPKRQRPWKIK